MTVLVIGGPQDLADVPRLCERARALLEASAPGEELVCDVGALRHADLAALDALARVKLVARRLGREMRLRDAPAELRELVRFLGFDEVVSI